MKLQRVQIWNYLHEYCEFVSRTVDSVKRVPRAEHQFMRCEYPYTWLHYVKKVGKSHCIHPDFLNVRYPSSQCKVSCVRISGRLVFPCEGFRETKQTLKITQMQSRTQKTEIKVLKSIPLFGNDALQCSRIIRILLPWKWIEKVSSRSVHNDPPYYRVISKNTALFVITGR
jgi:hypothetical protein